MLKVLRELEGHPVKIYYKRCDKVIIFFIFLGPPGPPGIGIPGKMGDRGEPGRPGKTYFDSLFNKHIITHLSRCRL